MSSGEKWTLQDSGRVVEDVLYLNAKLLNQGGLWHNWILDTGNPATKNLFTDPEWEEILQVHNHVTPEAFPDLTCLLSNEVSSSYYVFPRQY